MEIDWEEITSYLYDNIKPIGGDISSRINASFSQANFITNMWMEFDMNEFKYTDPFYGEQSSTSPFRMNISLGEILSEIKIESLLKLEFLNIKGKGNERMGSFSNSLDLIVHEIKFGKLYSDKTIDFQMTYSLTNSDSYGMMTGSVNDHVKLKGEISTKIKLKELMIEIPYNKDVGFLLEGVNAKFYDVTKMYEAADLSWSRPGCKTFYIPYTT